MKMHRFYNLMSLVMVALSWSGPLWGLGDQHATGQLTEPKFVKLEIGQDLISGCIRDENHVTEMEQISFFGHTSVGGICREDDDSVTTIDLALTKRLQVLVPEYRSVRYPHKEFCLVRKTSHDDVVTNGLLFPRKIVICGVQKKTMDQKAWFLNKISFLDITVQPVAGGLQAADSLPIAPSVPATPVAEHQSGAAVESSPPVGATAQQDETMPLRRVVLEKQSGAMESKSIGTAFTDIFVAFIVFIKAIFESVRTLLF